jgi:hypothetical protein
LEGRGKLLLSQLNLGEQHLLDHIDINFQGTENGWRLENGKFRLKDLEGGFHFEQFHAQSKLQSLPEGRPVGFPMNIGFSERDNYKLALHISPNKNTKTPIAQESDLAILPFVGPYLSQAQLAGRLELQANFEGQLGQFQGSVEGQVKNLSLLNTDISPLNFRGFLNHSFVDLTFDQSGQALRGRISFDLNEEDIPYEWYISMHQFDIRPFGFGYFSRDPRNFAYLSADWKLKGNFMNWWQSRGDFNLNELIVKYNHQTELTSESVYIKNHNPVKLVMTPERWYLDNNEPLTILGDDLVFKLSLGDSRLPERLSLDIESVVRFGLLKKLFDQVETASGAAMANLSLKGPISNLRSTMAIKSLPPDAPLSDGHALSIGISNIRPAFQNIDFAINYSDGLLLVKRFQSEKGQGNITASGQVEWGQKSSGRTNLVIDLNNTNFITPVPLVKSLDSNLTGTINVSGASFPYLISGDVAIVKSRSTRDFDLTAELMKELRKTSFHLDSADRKQYFNFNLNVKADESVIIRNRNINIVLSSDLVIKGSENKPEILGQVEVNRGKFVYKRDFEIQRGLITFDDPIKLDPAIDIIASADVSPYRVTIIASGRASKPVVDMTVDPPTKEDGTPITPIETIVLISRGRLPTNTFSFEERDAVGAEALNLFVGQFEQPVEKLFDLTGQDIIQEVYLDTYPSEVDGSPTLRLNFPINIIGGLDLTLRSDPDTLRLSAEYPIHDSISAYVDFIKPNTAEEDQKKDASNTAFDLKFRFAFP